MLPLVIRALGLAHAGRRERDADRVEEQQARRAGDRGRDRAARSSSRRSAISPTSSCGRCARISGTGSSMSSTGSDGDAAHKKLTELHCDIELAADRGRAAARQRSLPQRQAQGRGAAADRARARSARGPDRQPARGANRATAPGGHRRLTAAMPRTIGRPHGFRAHRGAARHPGRPPAPSRVTR